MATLILSTVGTLVGGPIGSAIGATIGQAIDARLFSPKGREGPRLDDLRVQTSSYGVAIPRLYGRMRVSGTVIWATDLIERRTRQSNGKGRGSSTTFSYSVSIAVALSSRPILGVGRIWAEGNLLRGAGGDFKSPTGFRLHTGDKDQPVDPLMAAAEGAGQTPAYRGIAYAVFEEMDLAPFGNRIPSLSFEVQADDGPLTLADPVGDILGRWQPVGAADPIAGCALGRGSGEEAIGVLAGVVDVDRLPGGENWLIGRGSEAASTMLGQPMGEAGRSSRIKSERRSAGAIAVPQQVRVTSFDPARDFQIGVQQVRVAGGAGREETIALPVAMAAGDAKRVAMREAVDAASATFVREVPQGFPALAIPPGARVEMAGERARMQVDERRIGGTGVMLTLRPTAPAPASGAAADSGRAMLTPDLAIGTSIGLLFDLPSAGISDRANGRLVLAAGGSGPGWRSAAVSVRMIGSAPLIDIGTVTRASVLGRIESVEPGGRAGLFDRTRSIVVQLASDDMPLVNASEADVLAGANLAAAGDEVLQFARAEPLGERRWRLSGLLRGRMGTEDAIATLAPGAGFALLEDTALFPVETAAAGMAGRWEPGAEVRIEGVGDAEAVVIPVADHGRATRPLAPAHVEALWQDDGSLSIAWIRRSRDGFGWMDGLDVPLDERSESYRVTVGNSIQSRETIVSAPALLLSTAEVSAWRSQAATVAIAIRQQGERGESAASEIAVAL